MITILTPTFNRDYILKKAYNSLLNQNNKKFEWLIIDDGSTDKTKELVNKFKSENKIKIRYFYKKNGGKHTALNFGINKAKGDLILILDSDDYLRKDAVELVYKYWDKYKDNDKLCGITFLRKIKNPMYRFEKFDECISNFIDFKYNSNRLYDTCEVIKTSVFKEYPFPVFENEKFLSEIIVWGNMAKKYDMAFIPKEIYHAKYLEDGLTKNWFKLVTNNPMGARANNQLFMSKEFKFSIRLKNCIMFNVFSIISNKNIFKETKMKLFALFFYIPCFFIAKYLIYKYKSL